MCFWVRLRDASGSLRPGRFMWILIHVVSDLGNQGLAEQEPGELLLCFLFRDAVMFMTATWPCQSQKPNLRTFRRGPKHLYGLEHRATVPTLSFQLGFPAFRAHGLQSSCLAAHAVPALLWCLRLCKLNYLQGAYLRLRSGCLQN